jgi:hypothetical protein
MPSTSKKMSAAEMRANMMKKSGNLAAVAREKTVAETGPSSGTDSFFYACIG